MKVTRIACDNPQCEMEGVPEHVGRTKYSPPYAWVRVEATVWGPGPTLQVDVCDWPCVEPALREAHLACIRKELSE